MLDDLCSGLAQIHGNTLIVDVLYTSIYKDEPLLDRPYRKIQIDTNFSTLRFMWTVRSVTQQNQYDLVVSAQIEGTVLCWIASLGLDNRFVAYLHGNPYRERTHWKAHVLFFVMKAVVLRRLAGVFGTSSRQLEAFYQMFGIDVARHWVPNPVRRFSVGDAQPRQDDGFVYIVNVGRYDRQKGQDLLIDAFASAINMRSNLRLRLVGHGADEQLLRNKVEALGLQDYVTFEYYPTNPAPALSRSDIYVSSSRWEGWSLAICEALRFGLPVIATNCDFGPSEILTDCRLGRLVPPEDIGLMTDAILYYVDHLEDQKVFSQFRKSYMERFDIDRVVEIHAQALIAANER